jgi:hypothetical protein
MRVRRLAFLQIALKPADSDPRQTLRFPARDKDGELERFGQTDSATLTRRRRADPELCECRAVWLPADEESWRAYHGGDDLDEPAELFCYCPECGDREFGGA